MSRVIIKNLPSKVTERRLRELFARCGEVTDIKLVKTRSGVFRHFGFVGYASESQAEAAMDYFNGTFIDSSKISVEVALPYGDSSLSRPWSKYSHGSSAHQKWERSKRDNDKIEGRNEKKKDFQEGLNQSAKSRMTNLLEEAHQMESKPEFQEFLSVHDTGTQTWSDGGNRTLVQSGETCSSRGDTDEQPEEKGIHLTTTPHTFEESEGASEDDETASKKIANGMSDLEYLKSKMKVARSESEGEGESDHEQEIDRESESDREQEMDRESDGDQESKKEEEQGHVTMATTPYTIKMRGLPFRSTVEDIRTFFHPIAIASTRFTTDPQGRPSGWAYVDFDSEEDLKNALKRNGDCIGSRYIELFRDSGPLPPKPLPREQDGPKAWEMKAASSESIAESGRLFVRNLPYTTTEEQLSREFEKFGTLTESTLPLDGDTGRSMGIAFVTFMFPEHAVKAFEALDGQIFQGRLLHLLPAKPRKAHEIFSVVEEEGSSYKKTKAKKMKSEASSAHNWNALFLGANAVADAMANRYSTEKRDILDTESSGQSVAVRMALGETQLVSETREFLVANGVILDLFGKKKSKRSKTVILVKNLPFGTTEAELRELFSPFKSLNRVVLPPSGISALVEFTEHSSAKTAFQALAYSKYKHLPLYLEWAPRGVLDGQVTMETKEEEADEEADSEQSTVFVKNLNFATDDTNLREHFSRVGQIKSASVARKHNPKDPSHPLSMGFGFVEFCTHQQAMKAIKDLQSSSLDGHQLQLKLSHRQNSSTPQNSGKKSKAHKQKSAKILVRNIPFEATRKEVRELFRTFGELKVVRLPKKVSLQGDHRGFGFVEFLTKEDAKRAFEALAHSTHLYGRRLVLEWADEEESVDAIRKRTAEHFHGLHVPVSKKLKARALLDSLDQGGDQEDET